MELLQRLKQLQEDHKLNDQQFAARLGVSRALWTRIRRGERPIRYEVLSGAVQAFPENQALKQSVLDFLEGTSQAVSVA